MTARVAYIHGRPSAHPMHARFAESVGAEFHYVDFKMRWQDRNRSILYKAFSWLVCALAFPNRKKYDIFLVDNLHFMPVIMKSLGLLRRRQKIVVHMGSHTLYFMYAHRFSKLNEWLHKQALRRYDAVICEGEMAADLTLRILGKKAPPIYIVINGIPQEHFPKSEARVVDTSFKTILFMGHGPGKDRMWYKGLDIMLEAFHLALETEPELRFRIVGNWEKEMIDQLLKPYPEKTRKAISLLPPQNDLEQVLKDVGLYLHCARGEAYGITILIALANGVPAIVSEWTGAKEVLKDIDTRLIVPLDASVIAQKIIWYFNLEPGERNLLSERSAKLARTYTERRAVSFHVEVFNKMLNDLAIQK